MLIISRDTPCLYLTDVAKDRLPVFHTDPLKAVACAALGEARRSGGFALLAYVIMPDHLHVLTDGALKPSDMLRFIKGITRLCCDGKPPAFHTAEAAKPLI